MILIFVQTLVFVNNIHERPLRSLPFVPTRSPSSKLRLALACLRRRSWPITCLRCPLVFIARSSSSPARPYSSPLPLAKTIVFASIVLLGSFASDRSRSSRSLAFTARSSLIAVYSSSTSSPTQLHRPFVFIARSPVLVAFTARKGYSLCEYRLSRIVAVRPARSPSPAASSSSPIVVYSLPTLPNFSLSRAFSPPPFKSRDIFSPWNYFPLQCVRCGSLGWTVIAPPCRRSVSGRPPSENTTSLAKPILRFLGNFPRRLFISLVPGPYSPIAPHRRRSSPVAALSSSWRSHPYSSQFVAVPPIASHFSKTVVFVNLVRSFPFVAGSFSPTPLSFVNFVTRPGCKFLLSTTYLRYPLIIAGRCQSSLFVLLQRGNGDER